MSALGRQQESARQGGPSPQARASDPKVSAWVTANAGSGKTHVLVQRVLRLLLEGAPPSRIVRPPSFETLTTPSSVPV